MIYTSLLFDLDGTLTDPQEGITKCVQYALADQGIFVKDRQELQEFIGPPLDESFMQYYGMNQRQAWRAITKFRERFGKVGLFENRVYPGIPKMLDSLYCDGKILAVATSKPEIFAERILSMYGLKKYFQIVVGSELDGTRVKKQEVIEEAIRQLGNPKRDQILMIGDRKQDMLGAQLCGITGIGAGFGYGEPGELETYNPLFIADTVEELAKFLNKM